MMGLAFGLLYALLWWAFEPSALSNAWWYGLIFGAVHGLVAMAAMPMMSAVHPRSGEASTGISGKPRSQEGVALPSFGFGGTGFGSMTPLGIEMGHLIFGVVWGLVFWTLL